jgi:hypothetical protein
MAVRTPDPTEDEFFEGLTDVDGGVYAAMEEIVARLRINVPVKTDAFNARMGLTGPREVPKPKDYGITPGVMTDKHLNMVLVGCSTNTVAESPGIFRNESQVVIYSIAPRIEIEKQVKAAHHRAAIIRGIMLKFLTDCYDSEGRCVWRQLEPTGVSFLPQPYADYAGVACYYQMKQTPDDNFWTSLVEA